MQFLEEGILSTLEWKEVKGSVSKNETYFGNSMKLLMGTKLSPMGIFL